LLAKIYQMAIESLVHHPHILWLCIWTKGL
jgi:hypothetical protein